MIQVCPLKHVSLQLLQEQITLFYIFTYWHDGMAIAKSVDLNLDSLPSSSAMVDLTIALHNWKCK
jgi:hypothetical protein